MAKKLESSFINMLLSLTLVSAGMAAILALVFISTKDPIAKAEKEKTKINNEMYELYFFI